MKRMLINATQPEERRLAIVDGQKLMDFETEIEGREQRKGNIYKAVVTRVEPSLEACFVDYGEERHGFLPFKEISKSYFREGVNPREAKIQDCISQGQDLLIQVEKEERGNKGAALTTFVSLAGRYLVLMPNNPRGGGVSRRIEGEDREELKENLEQLEYPKGMSLIARTAGIGRSAPELQWDLNYMLKLWSAIEGASKAGKGAFLIYQESSLVIRAIRDYYTHDMGEILIDTDDIFEQARQFMAHVMPETEHKVKRYRDDAPLFSRFQIEHQIETAFSRTVNLPSGGAIVIDHTEALVSVDVNSARSTRGSDIEETATRTNLEAADEIARQMRLRDLGGLIVVDFIDMDESKNRRDVETRLKDALRQDRARVQFSTISKFGLLELSRQRLRPALSEGSHVTCPRCNGTGHIRDTESSALQILRMVQEESMKDNTAAVHVQVPVEVTSFLLNEKRTEITKIELKQRVTVLLLPNKALETPNYRLERLRHDDPRLENIQASYTMIDEPEEEVGITRRAKAAPRQEPVIKGVLPETPAPAAPPKLTVVPVAAPVVQPVAEVADVQDRAPGQTGSGFFGWVKSLFGGTDDFADEPVAPQRVQAVVSTATPPSAPQRTPGREGERSERGGRGRGGDRGRGDGRRGEGRVEGRSDNNRADGERAPRPERGGERGTERGVERGTEPRGEGRGRRPERGERPERIAAPVDATAPRDAEERAPREEREPREPRGEGRGRGPRRAPQALSENNAAAPVVDAAAVPQNDFVDTVPGANDPADDAENADRANNRRRRGRGGRGGRGRDEAGALEAALASPTADASAYELENAGGERVQPTAASGADLENDLGNPDSAEAGENRRRSRGGRGRARGDRNPAVEGQGGDFDAVSSSLAVGSGVVAAVVPVAAFVPVADLAAAASARSAQVAAMQVAHESVVYESVAHEPVAHEPMASQPVTAPAVVARIEPVAVAAPVVVKPPPVVVAPAAPAIPAQPFVLPLDSLQAVADAAGLQWVNSDASKVQAAQAAMAQEAPPKHTPRVRKAAEANAEGPLVLVETRKDLTQIKLPFETTNNAG
jgi:ribonuclease E